MAFSSAVVPPDGEARENAPKGTLAANKQRNLAIDLFKCVYSLAVVLFHFDDTGVVGLRSGRFAVEFFLLCSGVFFFMAFEKSYRQGTASPYTYIWKRFCRFFPWTTTALIVSFVVVRIVVPNEHSLGYLIDRMTEDIWELFLVKMNGLNSNRTLLNGPAWYISSLLIAEFVVFGCMLRFKRAFVDVIMPLTILMGFGYCRVMDTGSMQSWVGFTTLGTLRAYLWVCVSYYLLRISRRMKAVPFTMTGRLMLTLTELGLHALACAFLWWYNERPHMYFIGLCFAVALAIEFSGHSLLTNWLNPARKLIAAMGTLSLSIYLIHWPVLYYFKNVLYTKKEALFAHLGQFMVVMLICAVLHYYVTRGVIKLYRVLLPRIKRILIEEAA